MDGKNNTPSAGQIMRHRNFQNNWQALKIISINKYKVAFVLLLAAALEISAKSDSEKFYTDWQNNPVPAIGQNASDVRKFNPLKKGPRILLVGNSILLHGPRPEIGWTNNWGMAATAREKDFAHIMRKRILAVQSDAQFCLMQVADSFERSFYLKDWQYKKSYKWAYDFKPDIVLFFFGANVPTEYDSGTLERSRSFGAALEALRNYLAGENTYFFHIGGFYHRPKLDAEKRAVAGKYSDSYIDIEDIRRRHDIRGMFNHPNDRGMQLLAERFLSVISVKTGVAY